MPELPEVETIVRGLATLSGKVIKSIDITDAKIELPVDKIVGARIQRIERKGKYIAFWLSKNRVLIFHMRMSGKLARNCSVRDKRYSRLSIQLDQEAIHFVNPRRLGTVEYSSNGFPHQLGIDPISDDFTVAALGEILSSSRRTIKQLLLDQRKVAGVGNIYAAESLWRARVDPRRHCNSLSYDEIATLNQAIVIVLEKAIAEMGTTIGSSVSDYRDSGGNKGRFQEMLCVYGREGKPCFRCKKEIERIVQQGRATYLCSYCQE